MFASAGVTNGNAREDRNDHRGAVDQASYDDDSGPGQGNGFAWLRIASRKRGNLRRR